MQGEAGDVVARRMVGTFEAQQRAFRECTYPDPASRRRKLDALKRQLQRYQTAIAVAIDADYGRRSQTESKMIEVLGCILDARHAISHLGRWARPSRRSTELLFMSNGLRVVYQPKGVVGIVVPWNFPLYLAIGPLIAALAAGNRAMIKLPEITPRTNAVMARMLGEIFAEDEVAVIGGELDNPGLFSALPFDHLVFTGSPTIGRVVMRAAAKNLTPVTLELGGKSPAFVGRSYPVADAALRITHGKVTNCGQICVAPDYALVPRERVTEFVAAVKAAFIRLAGESPSSNPDYTCIVSDHHARRLVDLLQDARDKGAEVVSCADYPGSRDARHLPLQIVLGCHADMHIMRDEIFGPILPVVVYDTVDEVVERIGSSERPLALYLFSHDRAERDDLLRRTHSGGVSINDWGWHAFNHDAPFGGIGNSGMGSYHGVEGFRELSHAKTVFKRHRLFPVSLFYPPYGHLVQRMALRLFLGKADPIVGAASPSRLARSELET
jgi:coniferyl-aldehyde dehydrogenase